MALSTQASGLSPSAPWSSPWPASRAGFRVKLRWAPQELGGLPDCWEEVPEGASTVADLGEHIMGSLVRPRAKVGCRHRLLLSLEGFLLRPESSILVLRDGDLLDVGLKKAAPAKRVTEAAAASAAQPKPSLKRPRKLSSGVAAAAVLETMLTSKKPKKDKETIEGRAAPADRPQGVAAKRSKAAVKKRDAGVTAAGKAGAITVAQRRVRVETTGSRGAQDPPAATPEAAAAGGTGKLPPSSRSARRKATQRRLRREGILPSKAKANKVATTAPQGRSEKLLLLEAPPDAGANQGEEAARRAAEKQRQSAANKKPLPNRSSSSSSDDDSEKQASGSSSSSSDEEEAEKECSSSSDEEEAEKESSSSSDEDTEKKSSSSSSSDEEGGGEENTSSRRAEPEATKVTPAHVQKGPPPPPPPPPSPAPLALGPELCDSLLELGTPQVGAVAAYRLLELGTSFCPEVSEWRAGVVEATEPLVLRPWGPAPLPLVPTSEEDEDEENHGCNAEEGSAPRYPAVYDDNGNLNGSDQSFCELRLLGVSEDDALLRLQGGSHGNNASSVPRPTAAAPLSPPPLAVPPLSPQQPQKQKQRLLANGFSPAATADQNGGPRLPLRRPTAAGYSSASLGPPGSIPVGGSRTLQSPTPQSPQQQQQYEKDHGLKKGGNMVPLGGGWASLAAELAAKKEALAASVHHKQHVGLGAPGFPSRNGNSSDLQSSDDGSCKGGDAVSAAAPVSTPGPVRRGGARQGALGPLLSKLRESDL